MSNEPLGPSFLILFGIWAVVGLAFYVWYLWSLSRLFPRIGLPSSHGWIPVWNQWQLVGRGGLPGWLVLLGFVPGLSLVVLVVMIIAINRINNEYGKGAGFTVLGVLIPPVWAMLLTNHIDQSGHAPANHRGGSQAASQQYGAAPQFTAPQAHAAPGQQFNAPQFNAPQHNGAASQAYTPPGYPQAAPQTPQAPQGAPQAQNFAPQPNQHFAPGSAPVAPAPHAAAPQAAAPQAAAPHVAHPKPAEQAPGAPAQANLDALFGSPSPRTDLPPVPVMPPAPNAAENGSASVAPVPPAPGSPSESAQAANGWGFSNTTEDAFERLAAQDAGRQQADTPLGYVEPQRPFSWPETQIPAPVAEPVVPAAPAAPVAPAVPTEASDAAFAELGLSAEPVVEATPAVAAAPAAPVVAPAAPVTASAGVESTPAESVQTPEPAQVSEPAQTPAAPVASAGPAVPVVTAAAAASVAPAAPAGIDFDDDDEDRTVIVKRRKRWGFELPSGDVEELVGDDIVIGRRPEGPEGVTLLKIADPTRTLSKSHVRMRRDGETWTIEDLQSTNGVAVADETGTVQQIEGGREVLATTHMTIGTLAVIRREIK